MGEVGARLCLGDEGTIAILVGGVGWGVQGSRVGAGLWLQEAVEPVLACRGAPATPPSLVATLMQTQHMSFFLFACVCLRCFADDNLQFWLFYNTYCHICGDWYRNHAYTTECKNDVTFVLCVIHIFCLKFYKHL